MARGEEMPTEEKKGKKVLSAAEQIMKKFGRSIVPVGPKILEIPKSISTGSIKLDQAIGDCLGYPLGSCIEIYGWEGAGKTLIMYLAMAEAQRQFPDKQCVLIDAEKQFKYQSRWAQKVGVDVAKLIVLPCSTAEECFDMMDMLILGDVERDPKTNDIIKVHKPGNYSIIGVDSVTQLTSLVDVRKDMDETRRIGSQAAAIGQGLKKVTSSMSRSDVNSDTILMFINQMRSNPQAGYGANPEYRTGGNALAFYDTLALKVAKVFKSEIRDENGNIVSHDVSVKFEKNKAGSIPEDKIVFTLMHDGTGVDNQGEILDVAILNGFVIQSVVVDKKGKEKTVYNFEQSLPWASEFSNFGKIKFNKIIEERPEVEEEIRKLIKDGKIFTRAEDVNEFVPQSSIDQYEPDLRVNKKKAKNIDDLED